MFDSRPVIGITMVLWGMAASLWAPLRAQEPFRDPTRPNSARPAANAAAAVPVFAVTAIFISERRRVAVVNGKLVAEGDSVDGATVTEVRSGALTIQHLGKKTTLRLLETTVDKQQESEN